MIQSMTGFGTKEAAIANLGKMRMELRSTNHKFLEVVFHIPEMLISLEDKIKKEIEAKVKRGRLTCVITFMGAQTTPTVFINKALLKNYASALENIKKQSQLRDEISINTLVHLPGVLSLEENKINKAGVWPGLKILVNQTVNGLLKMRQKEGRALFVFLKKRAELLKAELSMIKMRFKKVIKEKLAKLPTNEERVSFLKETDIAEETERLAFHIRNFQNKLLKSGPLGKELDFIAQEMQREANTMAAKSFDTIISSRAVQIKSQIEKIREQVQNIE
jgi:uncharacterized protein (TIGR00255 family)